MKFDKKMLASVGVGVVFAVCLWGAVDRCGAAQNEVEQANEKLDSIKGEMRSLAFKVAVLDRQNNDLNNEIKNHKTSVGGAIAALNDSVASINNRLADCEQSRKDCGCNNKKVAKKAAVTRRSAVAPAKPAKAPAPAQPGSAQPAASVHAHANDNGTSNVVSGNNITVHASNNSGNVYINNGVINNGCGDQKGCATKAAENNHRRGQMIVTCVSRSKSR